MNNKSALVGFLTAILLLIGCLLYRAESLSAVCALSEAASATPSADGLLRMTAEHVVSQGALGGSGRLAGRSWLLEWTDTRSRRNSNAASLISGSMTLRLRELDGDWVTHRVQVVNNAIDIQTDEKKAVQFEILSSALEPEAFPINSIGTLLPAAGPAVILVAEKPMLLILARDSMERPNEISIAEAGEVPLSAHPAWMHPGPREITSSTVVSGNPLDCSVLRQFKRPLVSAPGLAWRGIPAALINSGGNCYLGPAYTLIVRLDSVALAPQTALSEIEMIMQDVETSDWSLCSYAWAHRLLVGGIPTEIQQLTFDRLACPITNVSVAVKDTKKKFLSGNALATVDVVEHRTPTTFSRATVVLTCETHDCSVSGWIQFEDPSDMTACSNIRIASVEPQADASDLFGKEISQGHGLVQVDANTLNWQIEHVRNGAYSLSINALAVYGRFEATNDNTPSTALMIVPRKCSNRVQIVGLETADRGEQVVVGYESYIDLGSRAVRFVNPRTTHADGDSAIILAPIGSIVHAKAWTSTGLQGQLTFTAGAQDTSVLTLERTLPAAWVRLVSLHGPVEMPESWWQRCIRVNERNGPSHPVTVVPPPTTDIVGISAFGRWGLRMPERQFSSMQVVLKPRDCGLEIGTGYAGSENIEIKLLARKASDDIIIDLGSGSMGTASSGERR